jgi:hypothetical protein
MYSLLGSEAIQRGYGVNVYHLKADRARFEQRQETLRIAVCRALGSFLSAEGNPRRS